MTDFVDIDAALIALGDAAAFLDTAAESLHEIENGRVVQGEMPLLVGGLSQAVDSLKNHLEYHHQQE